MFMRHIDSKAKARKAVMVNIIVMQEKFFDHPLRSLNDFLTLKNVFERPAHIDNRFSRFLAILNQFVYL